MRFRLLLLLAPLSGLLTACDPGVKSGPRLDFVGATRFTSSDRLLTVGGDTISTFVYLTNRNTADVTDNPSLRSLRIWVDYEPNPAPVVYPAGTVSNATLNLQNRTITYLDTVLNEAGASTYVSEFVMLNKFALRTTTGRETWHYETTDVNEAKAARSYRLTYRNADSTLAYHRYSLLLEAPSSNIVVTRRSYLDLTDGLVLPGFATSNNPVNQQLINLVCLRNANNELRLASPRDPEALTAAGLRLGKWAVAARNDIQLRTTNLNNTTFVNVATEAALLSAFASGQALTPTTRTDILQAGQVYAFNIVDANNSGNNGRKGLIYVETLYATGIPSVRLQVRVSKQSL